jgi:hypothetical protein
MVKDHTESTQSLPEKCEGSYTYNVHINRGEYTAIKVGVVLREGQEPTPVRVSVKIHTPFHRPNRSIRASLRPTKNVAPPLKECPELEDPYGPMGTDDSGETPDPLEPGYTVEPGDQVTIIVTIADELPDVAAALWVDTQTYQVGYLGVRVPVEGSLEILPAQNVDSTDSTHAAIGGTGDAGPT